MTKDGDAVQQFIQTQKQVLDFFQCEGDFFIKPLMEYEWTVCSTEDFYFLSYWMKPNKRINAVIVKRNLPYTPKPTVIKKRNIQWLLLLIV